MSGQSPIDQGTNTDPVVLSDALTLDDVVSVARHRRRVALLVDDDTDVTAAVERMRESAAWVDKCVTEMAPGSADGARQVPYYSINTGFGPLAGRQAFDRPELADELSRRLILSNASGFGPFLEEEVVRAALLIRANALARGYSGVRVRVVNTLIEMLNRDVYPAIPAMGSVGASGDLIPLAHLALVMSRPPGDAEDDLEQDSGEAFLFPLDGERVEQSRRMVSGRAAMDLAGIPRVSLIAKEGLALVNGTAFSAALSALAVADAQNLIETSEIALALTVEACEGFRDAFLPEIHRARGHRGQIISAANVYALLSGSKLVDGDRDRDPIRQPPQDAYALRCGPQVLGAVRDTVAFARVVIETEINAATDNPLIFTELPVSRRLKAVSGGNFHGEYLALIADFVSIALTELGSISERRIFRLTDRSLNRNLPDMLIDSDPVGLDCGLMLPQYLAASLVSECKTLAHPDSVDSIPTGANQEDHVSMSMNAGLHARQVVRNIEGVVAVELFSALQALDLRLTGLRFDHTLATHRLDDDAPARARVDLEVDDRRLSLDADRAVAHVKLDGQPVEGVVLTVMKVQDGSFRAETSSLTAVETRGVRLLGQRTQLPPWCREDLAGGTRAVYDFVRSRDTADGRPMTRLDRDTVLYPYVRALTELVHNGQIVGAVQRAGFVLEYRGYSEPHARSCAFDASVTN